MKPLSVAVTLVLLAALAVGDDKLPPKVVRVVGTSEVKVAPDRAVIEIGVEKQNASARLAKQSETEAARKILAGLHASGIDEKDIHTAFLALRPQFDHRNGMRISYFVAEQTMSITVRDLSKLDALLETLIQAGGNRIDSIEYQTSELRLYRDQARELAVKAAREKAQALAKALGQDIGKAYAIEEVPESTYQYGGLLSNAGYEATRAPARSGPSLAAGQKTISASVVVSFDLN